MPRTTTTLNPRAMIAIGVCFIGAGVAFSAALHAGGASGAGTVLIGVGVIFMLIGVGHMRRAQSKEQKDDGGQDGG